MRPKRLCLAVLVTLVAIVSASGPSLGARLDRGPDRPVVLEASLRRIALGVTVKDGRQMSALAAFRDAIGGRTPATWSITSDWGDPATRDFPTLAASRARERGATPLIWWQPVDPDALSSPTYARHANLIAGRHDDYIRRFARAARDFGSPVILRFAHEANGNHFPWGVTGFDNTAASYVGAWRRVHRLFREVGATNVKFLWSVAKKACPGACNPYAAFYPGDAYVDYLGFSNFNWGSPRAWQPMVKGFRKVTDLLSQISPKPIVAAENASAAQGGDKAAWIREGYRAVYAELPRISAIIYLDVDLRAAGHPDWRLGSPAAALAAYARIASLPEFQGRLPGG
jgi:hypothetical protein